MANHGPICIYTRFADSCISACKSARQCIYGKWFDYITRLYARDLLDRYERHMLKNEAGATAFQAPKLQAGRRGLVATSHLSMSGPTQEGDHQSSELPMEDRLIDW